MKRCPSCNFPNIDSDRTCFKCGTLLPAQISVEPSSEAPSTVSAEVSPEPTQPAPVPSKPISPAPLPTTPSSAPNEEEQASSSDELRPKSNPVFDSGANVSNFIHTPTKAPLPKTPEVLPSTKAVKEACATSDIPLPQAPPEPPTTSTPTLGAPARIIPKYKSFNTLSLFFKVLGIFLGLLLITLGTCVMLTFPNILGIIVLVTCIIFGIINMILGFVIAAVLGWLNDAECNQRKQIELLGHIYHKISEE